MDYLSKLEHYCIHHSILNVHTVPRNQECPKCRIKVNDETAAQMGLPVTGAYCPSCKIAMVPNEAKVKGDLHAELCIDKYMHYPEMLKEGKITPAEYQAWVAGLTDREKQGFYERSRTVPLHVELNDAELGLEEKSPEDFKRLLLTRLMSNANMRLQHDHQERHTTSTHRFEHHLTDFRSK